MMYDQGDFTFIKCNATRHALQNMYKKINDNEKWDFFENDPPKNTGYMFWHHPYLLVLNNELGEDGHSGASFAICLRHMRKIKQLGWEHYVQNALKY